MQKQKRFEVIVVGGGLVGATTACALAQSGIDVALMDMFNPQRQWTDDSVDLRVSALTKASQNILETLAVWKGMVERGVSPYKDMRVWDAKANGELHFDCADTEFNALGHIVENRVTVASLWDKLETLSCATCITDVKVSQMQLTQNGRTILLEDGRQFDAELVIAADGRDSSLRSMVGIDVTGWSYKQDGLVATISTENSHQMTAWQRFLDEGPLAFLPLRNGQCSIVWTLASDTAKAYLQLSEQDFLKQLEQASAGILGGMLKTSSRAAFPLRFQYAKQYTENHFALVGDAAHAMHPLAGQGANAGLLDAAALSELVIKTKRADRPLTSAKYLRQYERWRKGDNLLMMSSMELINKIFAIDALPLISLRSAGMNLINKTSAVKALFNNHAMGLRDDLPLLAKKQRCW
ncbi:MAG: UbiH/UbiF/VisC/COQ6 family ubiquinone biosynthesis hydroxylase [Methylococcales symbiont of Hymedesmia sp. n. MRB-2018]|nr:MAG: UbiH/UbiF/VisC/COQ6 family ubiquinone biosynthesis hydroxylase [Methylococcales symbiont of Hymedesmia sp. n. MRB-2018]KAF3983254.1 MAG: UbiH/UbiF/VisC/COQ6 family ubiquinone biosynthesis hydroxylase [Methylococcales symbiont of Hymedesmia sp. n. MRB-2018]